MTHLFFGLLWASTACTLLLQAKPIENTAFHRVPLIHNAYYKKNTTMAIARAQAKHGARFDAPTGPDGMHKRQEALVPLRDFFDFEYLGQIKVGTPAQSFYLQFDTGSSDLWLSSTDCKKCKEHVRKFDASRSSTYKHEGKDWGIMYLDRSQASGTTGIDNVQVDNLIVHNQRIELAIKETEQFDTDPADGILGLGFSRRATVPGTHTLLENMLAQNLITKPIFGVTWIASMVLLSPRPSTQLLVRVLETIGQTCFSHFFPPIFPGHWQIMVDGLKLNDGSMHRLDLPTVVDTGTSIMLFDQELADLVAAQLGAEYDAAFNDGGYAIDCNNQQPLTFVIGGVPLELSGQALVGSERIFGKCYANFAVSPKAGISLLGDSFLKNFYTVFDQGDKPEVRFAKLKR
ncbi:aspartic peptidase domain-containing protein [Gongronella butleri]|nr:aspartic peptidase domain-containing protein [Gongronella butleri]